MTATREGAMPASECAEAYLRLRAEAELRAALGFPRVKRRRHHDRRRYVLRRSLRAKLRRRRQNVARTGATYSAGSAGNVVARLAGWAAPATSAVTRLAGPLNQISARLAFRLNRARWRWMRLTQWRRRRADEPAAAQACVDRLQTIAHALTAAGAVTKAAAMAVVSDLTVALAARSLIDQEQLLDEPDFPSARTSARARTMTGSVQYFPIGIAADCRIDDKPSRIYLSALVLSSAQATMETTLTFPPDLMKRGPHPLRPLMQELQRVSAVDDRGGSYRAHFSGGGGGGRWDGRFDLSPLPPAGLRWLDFTVPGENVVRVPLDMPAAPLNATFTPLPPQEHAERYLDGVTTALLLSGAARSDDQPPEAILTASALFEAGVLGPDSAALGRLAAATAHVGIDLPATLTGIRPRELPAEWLSLHERRGQVDGPTGVVPFAAVLPELDEARCVLTGLRSEPEHATLHMHAQGWPDRYYGWPGRTAEAFWWTARDDVGGWYLAEEAGGSFGGGEADVEFRLHPALNPRARVLEVILTGPSGEVSVTVPLEWQEGI